MEAGDSFFDEHLSDYSDDFEEDEPAVKVSNKPPLLDFQSTPTPRHAKQDSSFSSRGNKTDPVFRKTKSQYMSGTIKRRSLNRSSVKGTILNFRYQGKEGLETLYTYSHMIMTHLGPVQDV